MWNKVLKDPTMPQGHHCWGKIGEPFRHWCQSTLGSIVIYRPSGKCFPGPDSWDSIWCCIIWSRIDNACNFWQDLIFPQALACSIYIPKNPHLKITPFQKENTLPDRSDHSEVSSVVVSPQLVRQICEEDINEAALELIERTAKKLRSEQAEMLH